MISDPALLGTVLVLCAFPLAGIALVFHTVRKERRNVGHR